MVYRMTTTRGYPFPAVSSAMQKAMRRGRCQARRILGAGIMGERLRAIRLETPPHRQRRRLLGDPHPGGEGAPRQLHRDQPQQPGKTPKGRIFISKAVILLCLAKKSRDADHLQNFVYDQQAGLDPETLAEDLRTAGKYVPIPDYAYDCHTKRGRRWGSTKADFFKAEQDALQPRLPGLFDDLIDS